MQLAFMSKFQVMFVLDINVQSFSFRYLTVSKLKTGFG